MTQSISRNIGHIPALHHLRGFAAVLIALHHYLNYYSWRWVAHPKLGWAALVTEGYTALGLFFSLSGFLFATIALDGGEIRYWPFLRNRALRILPLYTVIFFVGLAIDQSSAHGVTLLDFFLSNAGSPVSMSLISGAAWSISVEFAFYLIFPFLMRFLEAEGPLYLLRLIVLIVAFKAGLFIAVEKADLTIYASLLGRLDQFVIGMLAAALAHRWRGGIARTRWVLLVGSVAALLLALAYMGRHASLYGSPKQWQWILWPTVEASLWSSVIVAYVAIKPRWPAAVEALLEQLGELSYSIYMLHGLVIYGLFETFGLPAITGNPGLDLALSAIPVVLGIWLLASLSYRAIERPFLDMRRRYVADPPAQSLA